MKPFDLSLYLVLDPGLCGARGIVETARVAVAGGTTMVQLRDKTGGTERMIETGRALKAALAGSGAHLIINDDIEAARAIGADGVHVGQGDTPVSRARALIGPKMILGLSVEDEAGARAVDLGMVDYVGIGPVFATRTKPDHKPPIGFDGLARLCAMVPVPAVAIGGLKAAHVAQVLEAGVRGLAVVSAICGQPDPQASAGQLAWAISGWRGA